MNKQSPSMEVEVIIIHQNMYILGVKDHNWKSQNLPSKSTLKPHRHTWTGFLLIPTEITDVIILLNGNNRGCSLKMKCPPFKRQWTLSHQQRLVGNITDRSAEEFEFRGGWLPRSTFWGHFKAMGYLHRCSDFFTNYIFW